MDIENIKNEISKKKEIDNKNVINNYSDTEKSAKNDNNGIRELIEVQKLLIDEIKISNKNQADSIKNQADLIKNQGKTLGILEQILNKILGDKEAREQNQVQKQESNKDQNKNKQEQ